jgi:hypothetical protein
MAPRLLLRTAAPLAVAALTLAAALTPAQASPAAGWRIAEVYGPSAGYPNLQSVAASGRDDAWVSGESFGALVIYHWNGTSWKRLTVPARFASATAGVNDTVIGAASRNNMWTFPTVTTSTGAVVQYALHRYDGAWQAFKLGSATVLATAVFGPDNAWSFGEEPMANPPGLGFGPPYTIRYNGHAWRRVSMPGTALSVSALSADDMWAFGPTAKTAGETIQDMVAMHWNGNSWSTLTVPRYLLAGKRAYLQQAIAAGPSSLWVVEGLPANPGTGQPPAAGLVLAHWNGHRWSLVKRDRSYTGQGGLASDGHGGVWFQAVPATSGADVFLHWSGGRLAVAPEPSMTGLTTSVSGVALVPGTTSLWAAAELSPGAAGFDDGGILQYTP